MPTLELTLSFLLVAVIGLCVLAQAIAVPYPIVLVLGGSALGFVPGTPHAELDPDLVLLIFLPPLLFQAALSSSVRDLRANARAISLGAVGLVLFTTAVVAACVRAAVPSLPWGAAFAFGAIVSPTDPLAATVIMQRLGVPRRIVAIVEGESLVNDGSALVVYATAVAVVLGGDFDVVRTTGTFVLDVAGGLAVGLVVAEAIARVLRRLEDDTLSVVVSVAAGYAAFLPAERLGVSGVIAVVVAGLVLGRRHASVMTSGARLQGYAFWRTSAFLLNAVLFVLVGLQLPSVLADQDRGPGTLVALGAFAGLAVIATRLAWLHAIPYALLLVTRRADRVPPSRNWRARTVLAWAGLRGAVSLAAALALPVAVPQRDLLIWMTLCVIFATLVLQGLSLPVLIRRLRIAEDEGPAREELLARRAAGAAALSRIDGLRVDSALDDESADHLRREHVRRLDRLIGGIHAEGATEGRSTADGQAMREVVDAQRQALVALRDDGAISDEVLFELVRELDLELERLR